MARKRRPPKPPKPPNKAIEFGETIEDTLVPDGVVKRYTRLTGVQKALDKVYGTGGWSFEDARQYVAQREWAKKRTYERWLEAQESSPETVGEPGTRLQTDDDRVARIMEQFPELTEVQRPMVERVVAFERVLAKLEQALDRETSKEGDAYSFGTISDLINTTTKLQGEVRQMQKALGIDAASQRGDDVGEIRAEIMADMDRAQALLQKECIRITCPTCSAEGIVINMGWLLFHFRQDVPYHLWALCPNNCGQGIHIAGGPGRPPKLYAGPEHARPPRR